MKLLESQARQRESEARTLQVADAQNVQQLRQTSAEQTNHLRSRNATLEQQLAQMNRELALAHEKVKGLETKAKAQEDARKEQQARRMLLGGAMGTSESTSESTSTSSGSTFLRSTTVADEDPALEARVWQLAEGARVNGHLRAQQNRIKELSQQNKVHSIVVCHIYCNMATLYCMA